MDLFGYKALAAAVNEANDRTTYLARTIASLNIRLAAIDMGLGRVLAKLDPTYGKSEHDPERIKQSIKDGEEIIRRLKAEAAALHNQGALK